MRRGFTLLELIVVIIIIGILSTLGFAQYSSMIEKARGAEARTIAGTLRTLAAGMYMDTASVAAITNAMVGVGSVAGMVSSTCSTGAPGSQYYFSYGIASTGATTVIVTATRCTVGGKTPTAANVGSLTLTSNLSTGVDTWGSPNGY